MIVIENLKHVYPGGRRQPARTAIHDLSLSVPAGAFCILSGPNGSGKSTLFRILCGLARPSAGRVAIAGHDMASAADEARRVMGVVFQSPAVDKHLAVRENLELHAALYGIRGAELRDRMAEALGWSDLKDRLNDKVETLSGGLARQVELAKCLLTRPQVLLLDEPTTGLDPASRRSFLTVLKRVQKSRGMTVLMTSHVFSEAEDADSVAIMRDGRLLAYDSPAALRARIGQEVLVIQARDAAVLKVGLAATLGLPVARYGDELRVEDLPPAEVPRIVERALTTHRDEILSIAVKQPTLEDVFIHITGKSPAEAQAAGRVEEGALA
ncbi:ATP-binding cassette domain-containing protein [Caenispirillum bisanense]|uniref:ABC-2 type transport system ATP-binding protein n=1 Tax=Caenispirillum bisanense TaxID=414052 RepID=A0A286GLW1_9PROT|nr:ABC transporter ATP-binding protein [Caenispirillum bisanense]SOD96508.1 ABC-2 type transport system ATP-binding protein [Caenispirillum bisanense]